MSDRATLSTVRNAARVLKAFSSRRRTFGAVSYTHLTLPTKRIV